VSDYTRTNDGVKIIKKFPVGFEWFNQVVGALDIVRSMAAPVNRLAAGPSSAEVVANLAVFHSRTAIRHSQKVVHFQVLGDFPSLSKQGS
jgi:hypothetical protein